MHKPDDETDTAHGSVDAGDNRGGAKNESDGENCAEVKYAGHRKNVGHRRTDVGGKFKKNAGNRSDGAGDKSGGAKDASDGEYRS